MKRIFLALTIAIPSAWLVGCAAETVAQEELTVVAETATAASASKDVETPDTAPTGKGTSEKGTAMSDDLPEQFQDIPLDENGKTTLSEEQWKQRLTPNQFYVCREHGTEPSFRNEYHDNKKDGLYRCVACGQKLFTSETKYDSGTGWPSFWQPITAESVGTKTDRKFFMVRTEVHCSRCQSHLGHVFEDGPQPTGLRYCMNSAAMLFEAEKAEE